MDLLCLERPNVCNSSTTTSNYLAEEGFFTRATTLDPAIVDDERVLQNLLRDEDKCLISSSYFNCVQTSIKSHMRRVVASWLLEVCDDQPCQEGVFSLAMNYLDRFLSTVVIHRSQLQLLGAVCLFVASKIKDSRPISAERLCMYTANSILLHELTSWELMVVSQLKWDLWAIIPHDFLDHILRRLQDMSDSHDMIRRHAQTFMTLCATDFNFSMHSPSIIAAASVGAAAKGLIKKSSGGGGGGGGNEDDQWTSLNNLLVRLHEITNIETDVIRSCLEQIETLVATTNSLNNQGSGGNSTASSSSSSSSSANAIGDKMAASSRDSPSDASCYTKAETPTDVRDILF